MEQPGINVLAHRGQHDAEKPTVPTSSFGVEQVKVILFAFDGAFGTRAGIAVTLPEVRVSGDEGVEAVVLFGVGIDDPTVGRAGAAVIEKGAVSERIAFPGGSQRAAPLDAHAVRAEAPAEHRFISGTEGSSIFKTQGAGIFEVVFVAFIEGDNQSHVPLFSGQAIESQGIVGFIERSGLEGQAAELACPVE